MKTVAFAVLMLAATPVLAQTPPSGTPQARPATTPARSSDLTRSLNGTPPASVATETPTSPPPLVPRPTTTATPTSRPPAAVPPATAGRVDRPSSVTHTAGPEIVARPTATRPVVTPPPPATSAAPAAPTVATPAPAPAVLNAAAVAALPFAIELPTGFQIVTGRPGPNFKVYTVRRGSQPFVMIYAGPSSQFPIYDGEMAVVGGRTSVVVTEGTQRRALEHLFTSQTAPREIHVWVSSLDGADRALGERIAQSVDAR